ncbi:hypothetical protein FACS189413_04880 [Bacteroidia bacterium]|nr:hypothetical protein FACS189413_04880 [Bacteroidia bacterium]
MKRQISILSVLAFFTATLSAQPYSLNNNSTIFTTETGKQKIQIETYGSQSLRILKYPQHAIVSKTSYSVVQKPGGESFTVKENDNDILLSTSKIRISIDKTTGIIRFTDTNGKLLLTEKAPNVPFQIKQSFALSDNEAIYGLGQDQRGIMNFRGQSVWLKQRNMYVAVPFLISSKAYGILWDNTSISNFSDNAGGAVFESETGDCIDYYFVTGNTMDETIAAYRELTGKAPMFPRWTFGFSQSRERYTNENEIVDIVKKYRELNLPLDGIIQDWRYWGFDEGQWNSTEFEPVNFPHPQQMIDNIHALNAHAMISVWPSFGNTSKIYQELDTKNLLFDFGTFPNTGKEKVYDAFSAEGRDIYWKYLNDNIFSLGMDAWWLDATEPEQSSPLTQIDANQTALGSYKQVANAYPLFTNRGVYEHQRAVTSGKRVMILTRSAFAGQQRYATAVWSGDVVADWLVFRNQISGGVNFSLSGIPYWTTDIGAFTVPQDQFPGGNQNPQYQELYVRWFQFGAFCPLFRAHGSSTPREIFNFGKQGDWAYDIQEKYLNLRYRLLPYIYSLSWQVSSENASLMRGIFMDFPNDTIAQNINNQYFFGKSILVAPVTEAQTKESKIYLPYTNFYDFWTGEKISGGRYITKQTPMDILPLYICEGSIIAMGKSMQYATQHPADTLEIRVYTGKDAEFTLYEDENDNYNYEKGAYSTVQFRWNEKEQTLTIGKSSGSFPGMLQKRIFNIVFINENRGIGDQLSKTVDQTVEYSGEEIKIQKDKPIRLAVIGATHGHISFILGRKDKGDFVLTGIYEPNNELVSSLSKRYGVDINLFYNDLNKMLDETKPEAAVAFGSVYEHLAVVEACAPRNIDVMVEKPLATNVKHAEKMQELAQKHNIQLLTDYETSWYPTTAKSIELVNDSNFVGKMKKVVIHDGHSGPVEIGCDQYFLEWLTDPVQNGGGALIDFGCYGANLMTALMRGEKPVSVTAVTKQYKPAIYPKVDDDATIIVNYPNSECIIQASWNWTFNRKDMEIYGDKGYIITQDNQNRGFWRRLGNLLKQGKLYLSNNLIVYSHRGICCNNTLCSG